MSDPVLADPPSLAELRRTLRRRVGVLDPGLRVVAEDLRGEATPIDLLCRDDGGGLWILLLGGPGEDAALLTRALAHRTWVARRLKDWIQLAPELDFASDAPVHAWLVCGAFGAETRAAVASLAGDRRIRLCEYRALRHGPRHGVLFEPLPEAPAPLERAAAGGGPRSDAFATPGRERRANGSFGFRTGLSETDLHLTAEERREFD